MRNESNNNTPTTPFKSLPLSTTSNHFHTYNLHMALPHTIYQLPTTTNTPDHDAMSHKPNPIVPTPPSRLSTLTSHLSTFLSEAAYYFSWYIVIAIVLKMLLISIADIIYSLRYCAPQGFLWRACGVPLLGLFFEWVLKYVGATITWWIVEVAWEEW